MIKLVFAGELMPGFDKETVIANLAKLLKQDPEKIQERLFSGKWIVIKKVDSQDIAEQWCAAFTKAGAVLLADPVAMEEGVVPHKSTVQPEPADNAELSTQGNLRPVGRKKLKPYIWAGAATLLVVVLIGYGTWWSRPLWQSSGLDSDQQALVHAMVSKDAYALGHVNVQQVLSLYGMTANEEFDFQSLPGKAHDLLTGLEQAGTDVRKQVKHVWGTGYFDGKTAEFLLLLSGNFNASHINNWLNSEFLIEGKTSNGTMITWRDAETCEKHPPVLAVVKQDYVIFGHPARVLAFQKRLAVSAPAAINLDDWKNISSAQPVSLAVFVPKNIGASLKGLPGMAAKRFGRTIAPGQGLYLGMDSVLLPPGIEINGSLVSTDEAFLQDLHDKLNNALASAKADAAQNWPELVKLYERFSVSLNPGYLRASARFDENLQQEINNWLASLFTVTLGGQASSSPVEERLDTNPPVFKTLASTTLPGYAADPGASIYGFHAQTVSGPFGFSTKKLALVDDGRLELTLAFQAIDLPNAARGSQNITARITGVYGSDGGSLLANTECGGGVAQDRRTMINTVDGWAFNNGEKIARTTTSGSLTMTLPDNLAAKSISKIAGVVDYALPVAVDRKTLKAPLAGQIIEYNGERLRFLGSDGHTLSYRYSGDPENLLHIYALNTEGEPLASGMSVNSLFGGSFSASRQYKGTIKSIEVVFAREIKHLSFPFELERLRPPIEKQDVFQPQPVSLDAGTWQDILNFTPPLVDFDRATPKAFTNAGPVAIALKRARFDENFGINLMVNTYVSSKLSLVNGLGTGEIEFTEIVDANGQKHPFEYRAHFSFAHDGGYWLNQEYQPDEERPWLKGEFHIRDRDAQVTTPRAISGILTLNAPQTMKPISMPLELGASWSNDNFGVVFSGWEANKLSFTLTGDPSELVAIQALNEKGEIVSHPASRRWMFGKPSVEVELRGEPASLVLVIAAQLHSQSFPFTLGLQSSGIKSSSVM